MNFMYNKDNKDNPYKNYPHNEEYIKEKLESLKITKETLKKMSKSITMKFSFNKISKNSIIKNRIEDAILRTNKIISSSYEFIKIFIIYHFENNIPLPDINKNFINNVFIVI